MARFVMQRRIAFVFALIIVSLLWGLASESKPKLYDPDAQACQMEVIRQSFRANLLPWQDQPAVVQQRLRQLQAAMTLDSLRECQAKGLLKPEQVNALVVELELTPAPPAGAQSPVRP
ncbi:MAG: hypothetical protein VKN56_06225 [Cyanobacteriota bacterium]|nr:hypothetical protein [Cyanobacteriota bacterium]